VRVAGVQVVLSPRRLRLRSKLEARGGTPLPMVSPVVSRPLASWSSASSVSSYSSSSSPMASRARASTATGRRRRDQISCSSSSGFGSGRGAGGLAVADEWASVLHGLVQRSYDSPEERIQSEVRAAIMAGGVGDDGRSHGGMSRGGGSGVGGGSAASVLRRVGTAALAAAGCSLFEASTGCGGGGGGGGLSGGDYGSGLDVPLLARDGDWKANQHRRGTGSRAVATALLRTRNGSGRGGRGGGGSGAERVNGDYDNDPVVAAATSVGPWGIGWTGGGDGDDRGAVDADGGGDIGTSCSAYARRGPGLPPTPPPRISQRLSFGSGGSDGGGGSSGGGDDGSWAGSSVGSLGGIGGGGVRAQRARELSERLTYEFDGRPLPYTPRVYWCSMHSSS